MAEEAYHRHVIAVIVLRALIPADDILIDDLEAVVVHVLFVDEHYVFARAVVPFQDLNVILLYPARFFDYAVVGVGDALRKEPLPFGVGECIAVEL